MDTLLPCNVLYEQYLNFIVKCIVCCSLNSGVNLQYLQVGCSIVESTFIIRGGFWPILLKSVRAFVQAVYVLGGAYVSVGQK